MQGAYLRGGGVHRHRDLRSAWRPERRSQDVWKTSDQRKDDMKWDTRPQFVPAAVTEAPLDFAWKGDRRHIGPVETVTPLMDRLSGSTICAQVTLMAGMLVWAAWRLKPGASQESRRFLQLAEAAF